MKGVKNIFLTLKGDRVIWAIMILLAFWSLLVVYSSTVELAYRFKGGKTMFFLFKQLAFLIAGFLIAYVAYRLPQKFYLRVALPAYVLSIVLLIITPIAGVSINSAQRWLNIPMVGSFQPSEFAKIGIIIYLAKVLTAHQENIKDLQKGFIRIIVPVLTVCFLIAPTDLSSAVIIFLTALYMMFVGRVRIGHILGMIMGGLSVFSLLVIIGQQFNNFVRVETWQSRWSSFLSEEIPYQAQQAQIAIAHGGLCGKGPGHSLQSFYLPSAFSDFAFAIITEEYGFIGGLIVILLYVALMVRVTGLASREESRTFESLLMIGPASLIVLQAMANIAVNVGLLPVTGLPLPLISLGGSSILVTSMAFGIILSVSRRIQNLKAAHAAAS